MQHQQGLRSPSIHGPARGEASPRRLQTMTWRAKRLNERTIAGTNKEKEKMKEREKDGKEKDTRYTNGHLFTTISVSGTTMCFVCSKSITAKEALICP
ncbi:hypothetical protein GDO81_028267, partial [Engystomops pustulosus]